MDALRLVMEKKHQSQTVKQIVSNRRNTRVEHDPLIISELFHLMELVGKKYIT